MSPLFTTILSRFIPITPRASITASSMALCTFLDDTTRLLSSKTRWCARVEEINGYLRPWPRLHGYHNFVRWRPWWRPQPDSPCSSSSRLFPSSWRVLDGGLLSARWYVNLYLPSALLLVSELSKSFPNTFGHVHPISIYHSVLEAMKLALVFLAHLVTVLPDLGAIR